MGDRPWGLAELLRQDRLTYGAPTVEHLQDLRTGKGKTAGGHAVVDHSAQVVPKRQTHTIDPSLDLTDTADLTRVGSSPRYGRSKLMDVMFTQELGRRLQGAGVAVTCCCPGFNATGLGRELPLAGALERALTALGIGNPRHGADIIVKLATDPEFADSTGGYFAARTAKPLQCPEVGRGEAVQRALWEATAELVHDIRRLYDA
ncbi:hypothetical protein [Streptomyces mirabilis]|uniref:hypothetical protein n=1 Tax=Streptomyces mirabilis TaxID=68239 RepID=UPI0033A4E997